jgi:multisubunit Na+/H+ antiporter MnhB subunit
MRIRFSPLLATGTQTMVPTLMLFSVYLLVVGHDVPGGGFAGGLIASSALLLVFLAFGRGGVRRAFPIDPETAMGVGLILAISAGTIGLVFGDAFLTYTYAQWTVPVVGDIKVSTLLLFDIGVYIVVIGLVATAILKLGSDRR